MIRTLLLEHVGPESGPVGRLFYRFVAPRQFRRRGDAFAFGFVQAGSFVYMAGCPFAAMVFLFLGRPWISAFFIVIAVVAAVLFVLNERKR